MEGHKNIGIGGEESIVFFSESYYYPVSDYFGMLLHSDPMKRRQGLVAHEGSVSEFARTV